jgi:hypothetical protein
MQELNNLRKVLDNLTFPTNVQSNNFILNILEIAQIKSKGQYTNIWLWNCDKNYFDNIINKLSKINLPLDGKHVTLTSRGITLDYIAYKNKFLSIYPNAEIDFDLVYNDDEFFIKKENGKVLYQHKIGNPFSKKRENLIGAYCVIKIQSRGEFQVTLDLEELKKHEQLSNMKYLYSQWWVELYKKTIIRKALKFHFEDDFEDFNKIDDEGMDNDFNNLKPKIEDKTDEINNLLKKINSIKDVKELETYYKALTQPVDKSINILFKKRKEVLQSNNK